MMKLLAFALMILGVVALIYGGIGYSRERTVLEVAGIKATATEHKTIPLPPVAGAIAVVGGLALLMIDRRRTT